VNWEPTKAAMSKLSTKDRPEWAFVKPTTEIMTNL
jgi:hypothetical protein